MRTNPILKDRWTDYGANFSRHSIYLRAEHTGHKYCGGSPPAFRDIAPYPFFVLMFPLALCNKKRHYVFQIIIGGDVNIYICIMLH